MLLRVACILLCAHLISASILGRELKDLLEKYEQERTDGESASEEDKTEVDATNPDGLKPNSEETAFIDRYMEQDQQMFMKSNTKKQLDTPPHVFMFLIDDLGFNDVGWKNPDVLTPNLDELAAQGVLIDYNYAQAVCSPSRGAFMSGFYPMHTGMQHDVIVFTAPECGATDKEFLPQKLKNYNYKNYMLGKWHLGFCDIDCTPLHRGFDEFYGFYQGYVDHYTHAVGAENDMGYDWRDGEESDLSANMTYATDLLTDRAKTMIQNHDQSEPMFMYFAHAAVHTPLQAPQDFVDKYSSDYYVNTYSDHRRVFMAMISAMDAAIGETVQDIKDAGMYDNSVIIFSSDNGGEFGAGSNIPLRGAKASIYEGGTRVPAFFHSPLIASGAGRITAANDIFHITDWHSTILAMAGGDPSDLDGVDQTDMLINGGPSARNEVLYTLDGTFAQFLGASAIRVDDYKLIKSYPGIWDGWEGDNTLALTNDVDILADYQGRKRNPSATRSYAFDYNAIAQYMTVVTDVYQLYDVVNDPSETNNLADSMPDMVAKLDARLAELADGAHAVDLESQEPSSAGNPSNYDGIWSSGWCEMTVWPET